MLTNPEQQFLELVSAAVFNQPIMVEINEDDWYSIIDIAKSHALLSTIAPIIDKLPESSCPQWAGSIIKCAMYNACIHFEHIMREQQKIINEFQLNDIECVVLKGSSISIYYPYPELRFFSDIDLLIPQCKIDLITKIMEKNGYTKQPNADNHPFHINFQLNDVVFEMHYQTDDFPDVPKGVLARQFMETAISSRYIVNYNEFSFSTLSTEHQAVNLLMHMMRHLNITGIGIKQLLDWAVYIRKQELDKWKNEIIPSLDKFGLLYFANIINLVCVEIFKLSEEYLVPYDKNAEDTSQKLIRIILNSGNLGSKHDANDYYSTFLHNSIGKKKKLSLPKRLLRRVENDYPITKKYRFLTPFMLIWIFIISIFKSASEKRENIHPVYLIKKSIKHNKFFKKLKLFS